MNFTSPPFLKPGATIGVMAPSSRIAAADLEVSKAWLEARGCRVFLHPQCHAALNQSAGTPAQKRDALHDLAADTSIDAVFFASGGNRALGVLDHLDYGLIARNPKIYMGFSDNTALLNAITARTGLVTWHGPTFKRLPKNPQGDFNLRLLSGTENMVPLTGAAFLRPGAAQGRLVGGNLAIVRALRADDLPDMNGAILFLEDIGEELSRLDRDFCALRRSGIFKNLSALILGQFTDMRDTGTPFGFTLEDIVAEHTAGSGFPVLLNAPFSHGADLYAFPVGGMATLNGESLTLTL